MFLIYYLGEKLYEWYYISLILFSYLSNYSQVGAVILFLHMKSDIFVHSTRYLLHTRFPPIFAEISGVILTINFIYMRKFVFGKKNLCYLLLHYLGMGYIV